MKDIEKAFPPSDYYDIHFEGPLLKCTNCNSLDSYYQRIKNKKIINPNIDLTDNDSFKDNYFKAIGSINNTTLKPEQRWFYKYYKYKKKYNILKNNLVNKVLI